jgi:bacillolysin/thermolysin
VPDRTHERLDQDYKGIPVFGADVTRQLSQGVTVSIFGTLHIGINVDPNPTLDSQRARAVIEQLAGVELGPRDRLELMIFPTREGGYALAYRARVIALPDVTVYFIDAHTGEMLFEYSDLKTQAAAVGKAAGVLGDTKKISTERRAVEFRAVDRLRPPMVDDPVYGGIATFDMRADLGRINLILQGRVPGDANIATDADNDWTERSVGDAHIYAGWVTDYLFKRFNRRGLDDGFIEPWNFVNPVRLEDFFRQPPEIQGSYYCNAAYIGFGNMIYGVGLPQGVQLGGQACLPLAGALDVVAHELAHGVTDYTSNLIYRNESGALNEAFSDMMGTSVEFFFQPPGSGARRADYLIAEDVVTPGGFRSMQAPRDYGDPDHRRLRCCVGTTLDNGGVHINSGIPNNAFVLAIEGGRNSTSGLSVEGVGPANREQIERIFYRAFAFLLPSSANFITARAATIQAARDLYGAGSRAERAVTQAWDAVGVIPRAAVEVEFWPNPVRSTRDCSTITPPCWGFVASLLTPPSAYIVNTFDLNFYDAAGNAIGTSRFDSNGFVAFFNDCGPGSVRLGPNFEACSWLVAGLGGRSSGAIQFVLRGTREDGTRLDVASSRLALLATSNVTDGETTTLGSPTFAKVR